jgi:hypothetical protein
MRRRSKYDDDSSDGFVDELPWDPFLDYVMGGDGKSANKSGTRGKRQQDSDADSFLDLLFPIEEDPRRAQASSRSITTKRTAIKSSKNGGKGIGSRMGFWRRNKRPQESEDLWDLGSIASSFEEFFEEEGAGAGKQKAQGPGAGAGSVAR